MKQKFEAGEITGRDLALARLLRRLVGISADDTVPDRLTGLRDESIDSIERFLAEAMRQHRLLTQHDDGTWWLVHLAVLKGWPRAAAWREQEGSITVHLQSWKRIAGGGDRRLKKGRTTRRVGSGAAPNRSNKRSNGWRNGGCTNDRIWSHSLNPE